MTRQRKSEILPAGEVVLVDKEKVIPSPPPIPTEIAPSMIQKLKPKKELSEKQKANLAKLIERNKQKAMERKGVVSNNIPETIPEDKVLLTVKPKRAYNRKVEHWNKNPTPPKEEEENDEEVDEKDGVMDFPPHPPALARQDAYEKPKNEIVIPKPKKMVAPNPKPKRIPQAPRHQPLPTDTETSSEEEDSEESDSEVEDYRIHKYAQKTHKRMEALKAIDQQMRSLRNPYEARGMSIF